MESIGGKILGATYKAGYFLDGLKIESWPYAILDILIVAVLLYSVYLLIRETRAMRMMYGLIILVLLMGLAYLLNLVLLNWILKYITTMLVVAIPIVFQPELRNALEKIGRSRLIKDISSGVEDDSYVNQILSAVEYLSKERIGALIVIQRKTGLREYAERGVLIDGAVSHDLICTIFYPKSPLHDGAVIIADGKIEAAAVMLPVTENEFNTNYGSRHRAAIGITENSDAVALIVSEETGWLSVALGGKIERRISVERMRNKLKKIL